MPSEKVEKTEKLYGKPAARPIAPAVKKTKLTKSAAAKTSSKKTKRNQRPPRAVRLSQAERRMQPRYIQRPDRIGVSVTLNMPRIKGIPGVYRAAKKSSSFTTRMAGKAAAKFPALARIGQHLVIPVRFRRPVAVAAVMLVVFSVVFASHVGRHVAVPTTGKVAAAVRTQPDFKPLVPSAAEASSKTYDGKRNLVAYDTTFSGARLTVSQQPLPVRFAHDPKALQAAADSINAKQRLDTAKGPLFIATNEQGDQLAIFAAPQVLLFIHSDRKLDDPSWKAFIELLQAKS